MAQQLRKDAVLTAPVCMAAPHKHRSSLFPAASAQHRDPSPASLRKNRHFRAISQPGLFFGECSSAVEHLTIQPLAGVSIAISPPLVLRHIVPPQTQSVMQGMLKVQGC